MIFKVVGLRSRREGSSGGGIREPRSDGGKGECAGRETKKWSRGGSFLKNERLN